ncbi:hypothetical protein DFH27DRAFT_238665 [Peziza echinospora]|nr:hypothetical protein DFH27DRAFT_238665 [Peziza echinospora]
MSNRNSTPDQATSSLRPPASRPLGSGHHLRASADMSAFPSPLGSGRIRPSSEIFLNPPSINQNPETEALDKAAQKWLADLEVYERTLEEMAAATLDQDFKDELSAIEQWFRVLSEAERTAALYALLQQTTQVQIRFFITVLQQMARSHPMSAILSPANFDKDAMSNRMSEAMNQMSLNNNRNSFNQVPPSPTTNRNPSGLDSSSIHAMFPDAAAALAAQRAKLGGAAGTKSNRNSGIFEARPSSNLAPTISTPNQGKDTQPPPSPWTQGPRNGDGNLEPNSRPKSAADHMGQWQAPPLSAGLRSPRPPQITGNTNLQSTTINAPTTSGMELPPLSPFDGHSGNWASMVNTPVVPMFNQAAHTNADMIANATAMKLAALSTVNNRIILDSDVGKFRRRPKNEGGMANAQINRNGPPMASPSTIVMYNEHGQPVQIPAAAAAAAVAAHQNNQNVSPFGRRSPRPNSPGIAFHNSPQLGIGGFSSPQNNGFLAAYDTTSPLLSGGGFSLSQFGSLAAAAGTEGYLSDEPSTARGRSPRARRGTSKPPEDPTDPALLSDISQWLRSLRLHKYTDNLKDLKWQELVQLSDEDLEKRGVNALGARRKMLKVFEQVNEAIKEGKLANP